MEKPVFSTVWKKPANPDMKQLTKRGTNGQLCSCWCCWCCWRYILAYFISSGYCCQQLKSVVVVCRCLQWFYPLRQGMRWKPGLPWGLDFNPC